MVARSLEQDFGGLPEAEAPLLVPPFETAHETKRARHRATLPFGAALSDHESAASNILEEYAEAHETKKARHRETLPPAASLSDHPSNEDLIENEKVLDK